MKATAARRPGRLLPAAGLLLNALIWGTSWWPFRQLQALGLHPLWATVLVYVLAVASVLVWRPQAFGQLRRAPALWVVVLAAGATNATFNWAMAIGDVVRVVLLFYLMPLWSALLARMLLGETLTVAASARMALALAGAAIVLWPADASGWQALPLPRSLADWLGVAGGFTFALNNVMLRREARQPEAARALAMFIGGMTVSGLLATALALSGVVAWPPAAQGAWLAFAAGLAVLFLISNVGLQYGASRLPANVTAVLMLSEVLFAAASAVAWGDGHLDAPLLVGGGLIVLAALLSIRPSSPS